MSTVTFERTITKTFEVQECINCGCTWAMPVEFVNRRRKDAENFYCPNGHPQCYTKSEADRIKEEAEKKIANLTRSLEWEKDYSRRVAADRDNVTNSLRATRGVVTKLKKRAAKGVCPCCNRYFVNVHRHMETQHPDFAVTGE